MDNFKEKWNNDSKYRAKIKLILYTAFVLIITISAVSNNTTINSNSLSEENTNSTEKEEGIIDIKDNYDYKIIIQNNDLKTILSGNINNTNQTIIKEENDLIKEYLYQDSNYYIKDNDNYLLTTKEEIYGNINPNYLSLSTINNFLNLSTKENNTYKVYIKDIILGSENTEYITIVINDNQINIDYTNLMKELHTDIYKYIVDIEIKNKEED